MRVRARWVTLGAALVAAACGTSIGRRRSPPSRRRRSIPSGHPYAGVDQAACTATAWKVQNTSAGAAAPPNLDYCNAVVRPEESWASFAFADKVADAVRVLPGRFVDPAKDSVLVWDQGTVALSSTRASPDPSGVRPGISSRPRRRRRRGGRRRLAAASVRKRPAGGEGTATGVRQPDAIHVVPGRAADGLPAA